MDGIKIDGVIFPKDLIMQDGKLQGYTMDYFQDSTSLNDYFTATRFVNCKDIFKAIIKASEILREIHKYDIKVQDLSFENILINNQGEVKYIDIDSCQYQNYESYFLSNILHKYNANTIRQLPATNHKQYKRKPMPLFPPIVWF